MQQTRRLLRRTLLGMVAPAVAFTLLGLWRFFSHQTPGVDVRPHNTYSQTLTTTGDLDFAPYSFIDVDGRPAGHDVELMALIANRLGMNLDLRLQKWSDARAAALTGKAQVLLGLEMGAPGMESLILSIPIVDDPFVVFGRKPIGKIRDLYGERLATLEGGGGHNKFVRPHRLDTITTVYPTYHAAFMSVVEGKNTFAIARYSVGRRMLAKIPDTDLTATGPRLLSGFMHLGVNGEQGDLARRIDEAVLELKRDGTLDRLQDKWLGAYVQVINAGDYLKEHLALVLGCMMLPALIGLAVYIRVSRLLLAAVESQREHLAKTLEYQCLLTEAAGGIFEIIHEVDVTNNRPTGNALPEYFAALNLPADTTFSDFIPWYAEHCVHPAHRETLCALLDRKKLLSCFAAGQNSLQCDIMILPDSMSRPDHNGEYCWVRFSARMFFWRMDNSVHMIACRQSIDEEKQRESALLDKAQRDQMTGLYNKSTVRQLIENQLACMPEHYGCALFMLDIDNFKQINDTLGHDFGDQIIMDFAAVLRRHCRESDVAGRVGGDEFVVFLPGIRDREHLHRQARRLVHALRRRRSMGEHDCLTSVSIGVAVSFAPHADFETLFKQADTALYSVKARGKNGYAVYDAQGI